MVQVHKEFTDSQVKELIERSSKKKKFGTDIPPIESHFQSGNSPKNKKSTLIYE